VGRGDGQSGRRWGAAEERAGGGRLTGGGVPGFAGGRAGTWGGRARGAAPTASRSVGRAAVRRRKGKGKEKEEESRPHAGGLVTFFAECPRSGTRQRFF
jgi:hypothetical protein